MEVGLGYLASPDSHPVFFSDAEVVRVQTIEEALLIPVLQCFITLPLTQIQDELVKQGWSRIAHNSVNEYFIILYS